MLDFFSPSELRKMGFGSFGRRILVKRSVKFVNPSKIYLGDNIAIDDYSIIHADAPVVLNGNNQIGAHCEVYGRFGLQMDNFSTLASKVSIFTESDDYSGASLTNSTVPMQYKPKFISAPVNLGKHSIVGCNSTILPSVVIGEGCAVGAHSLVKNDLEDWGIYSGVPAIRKGERSRDLLNLEKKYRGSV